MEWKRVAYGRWRAGDYTIQQINNYDFRAFKVGIGELPEASATLAAAKSAAETCADREG